MGALEFDTQVFDSDIYLALGLKKLGKGAIATPRILKLLSSFLVKSVHENEMQPEPVIGKDIDAIFHGLRIPTISIPKYIDRIFKYASCSPSCFLVAYIYLDRFSQQTDVQLSYRNVHRLLLTSVMVAAKFLDDAYFNNAYYARVGGISTAEFNKLEMKFLFALDFRLQVSIDTFERYCLQLQNDSSEGHEHEVERPIRACGIKESWPSKSETQCTLTK